VLQATGDLDVHLARTVPGQPVTLRLWRAGREETLVIPLAEEPVRYERSMAAAQQLGFLLDALTPELGVVVVAVRPASGATDVDISAGDLVREVDGHAVTTLAEFEQATRTIRPDRTITVLLQRDWRIFYVVITPVSPPTEVGRR